MKKADEELKAFTVKFPIAMLDQIKAWMKRKRVIKTSDGVRMLVAIGLDLDPPGGKGKFTPDELEALNILKRERQGYLDGLPATETMTLVEVLNQRKPPPLAIVEPAPPLPEPKTLKQRLIGRK